MKSLTAKTYRKSLGIKKTFLILSAFMSALSGCTGGGGAGAFDSILGVTATTGGSGGSGSGSTGGGSTNTTGGSSSLVVVSGDAQIVPINSQAPASLIVMAKDGSNLPISGQVITFGVTGGGTLSSVSATTDPNGLAAVDFTAGGTAGTSTVTATGAAGSASFTVSVAALTSYTIQMISGDGQSAAVGSVPLPTPMKVRVLDSNGTPARSVSITYSVQGGNGSFSGASSTTATTDTNGYAQATFTVGTSAGANTVRAAITSAPGIYTSFSATGTVASSSTVDLSQSTISLSQTTATANGANLITVTVLVKDFYGNLIPNASKSIGVTFAPSIGAWATSSTFTYTSTGTYTNSYRVGTSTGSVVFSATIGGSALLSGSATLALTSGGNSLVVIGGDLQQVPINTQAASSLIVMARDGANQPISGNVVTFSIASGGTLSATTVTTDSNGLAAVDFTAGGSATSAVITATSSVGSVNFTETVIALTSYTIQIVSGDAQSGLVGSTLTSSLKVLILNGSGVPASNVSVTFSVQSGNGSFSGSSSTVVSSDTSGFAQASYTLGTLSGTNVIRATITAAASVFTTFTETGTVASGATVDLTNSTISLSQNSAQANGSSLVTVTVTVRDTYGNLIPNAGQTISTSFTPVIGSWAATSSFSYSSTGTYTNTYKVGLTPGTTVFTGSINGSALLSGTASLLQNTGNTTAAGGATLTIVAGNSQTTGITQAASTNLKVIALDSLGIPISGSSVAFTVTSGGGTVAGANSTSVTTGSDGLAEVAYTGGATAGPIVVNATSLQGSVAFTLTVQDLTGYVVSKVSGDAQTANLNTALSAFTARVSKADGSAAAGVQLRFQCQSANCGIFSNGLNSIDTTTDSSGNATAVYTLGTAPGSYTVRAIIPAQATIYADFNATATVSASSAVSLANSTLTLSSSSVTANGSDSVVATVTVRDLYGNIIPSTNATIAVTPSPTNLGGWVGGGFTAGTAGIYTRSYAVGTVAGSIVFSATIGGSAITSGTATLTVAASATPDLTKSTISVLNSSLTANGSSTTTVVATLYDVNNNQISLGTFTVVSTTNTGTLTGSSMTYDAPTGTYRQTFTTPSSVGAGSATITLSTVNGSAVTGKTATVTLTASTYSATASTITIPNRVFTAYAAPGIQTITMTLKDANGNPIIVTSPTITMAKAAVSGTLSGSSSFGTVTSLGNGVYTATLTPPTSCTTAPCVESISATVTHASINSGSATAIGSAFRVQYTNAAITPAAAQSTVTLSSTTGQAGAGVSTINLTITLKTAASASVNVGGYGASLAISNSFGSTVSAITDNDNGTYTATVYSPVSPATGTITVTYGGTNLSGSPATVTFYGAISLANSTLSLSASTLSGAGNITVTLNAKDSQNNAIPALATADANIRFLVSNPAGGTTISGTNTPATSSSAVVSGQAQYYQTVTRASSPTIGFETATVSAQLTTDGGSTWNTFTSTVPLTITPANLAGVTINCANIAAYENTNIYVSGGTLTLDSWVNGAARTCGSQTPFRFASVTVDAGGIITHPTTVNASASYGMEFQVSGALDVKSAGLIDANNKGCQTSASAATLPDLGTYLCTNTISNSAPASHGNYANASVPAYDSASDPKYPGGAYTRAGGGIIRISANSMIVNGVIRSDDSISTGSNAIVTGAGGSVKLTVVGTTLTGSGSITAKGGSNSNTQSYNGCGGRIAILGNATSFAGTISAAGGTGIAASYCDGTLYFDTTAPAQLATIPHSIDLSATTNYNQSTIPDIISSSNNAVIPTGMTLTLKGATNYTFGSISNSGTLNLGTGTTSVTNNLTNTGTLNASSGNLNVGGSFSTSGTLNLYTAPIVVTGSFTQTAGSITHSLPTKTDYVNFPRVDITAGNITVTNISASSKGLSGGNSGNAGSLCGTNTGYPWYYTSAANLTVVCTAYTNKGGNHYTLGSGSTLPTWGNLNYPNTYGGGGAASWARWAGNGGGIIRLSTGGTLDVKGSIDASGGTSSVYTDSGGGAGGSIYINAAVMTSSNNLGTISSSGGGVVGGTSGTGGAGGIMRIYTTSGTYTGAITTSVAGGVSAAGNGAAGAYTISTCSNANRDFGYCTQYP